MSTRRQSAQRRWLWLTTLAAFVAACAPNPTRAGDDHNDIGYVALTGSKAKRFLIGNSQEFPRAYGTDPFRDITYFASEKVALDGYRNGRACEVKTLDFHEDSYCQRSGTDPTGKLHCDHIQVFAVKRALTSPAKTGELIGYLSPGDTESDAPNTQYDYAILKGNVTGCPVFGDPKPEKALELSSAEGQLVPVDDPNKFAKHASSRRAIERLLIGNSVFWKRSDRKGCGGKQYFASDGRIFSAYCHGPDPAVTLVGESRWKFVNGRFCLQDRDNHDAFDMCEPFAIGAAPAPSGGGVRFRVYSSVEFDYPNDDSAEPGLIMQGNPAGLLGWKP